MGGYDSGSDSNDGRDEDDEEEYEEVGNQLLGFMFGNVDNAGNLDVDYLDEDAKEHLAALADKLGSSLTDIDLSVKSPQTPAGALEQDYGEKAEDAVDYEDIDEQYEGPEIQAASEEDYLLQKKDFFFSAEVSLTTLKPTTSLFDDEDYDEDEEFEKEHEAVNKENEFEKEHEVVDKENEVSTVSLSGEKGECSLAVLQGEKSIEDEQQVGSLGTEEDMAVEGEDINEEFVDILNDPVDDQVSVPRPVLFVEDGLVILRFSEIFGIKEPLKKRGKGDQGYYTHRDKYNIMDFSNLVEEDEEEYLKGSVKRFSSIQAHKVQQDISFLSDDSSEFAKFGVVEDALPISDEQRKDSCLSAEPMKEDLTVNLSGVMAINLESKILPS